jgi:hypothetical protein
MIFVSEGRIATRKDWQEAEGFLDTYLKQKIP